MRNFLLFTILLSLGFSSRMANAAIIFSDKTAFDNSLGQTFVDDYESDDYQIFHSNEQMSSVHNETTYMSTGWSNTNVVTDVYGGDIIYCAGCNGSFLLDFTSTSLSNAYGIFGVGLNFFNGDIAGVPPMIVPKYSAYVTFGNNISENFVLPSGPYSEQHFWGITSETGIKSIHFGFWDGVATQDGYFAINDLIIGNQKSTVSEPGAVILLCLGLTAILTRRKSFQNPG